MSLLKKSKSKKLQSLILSSILALSFNNLTFAAYNSVNYVNTDLNHSFKVKLGEESTGNANWYLYYTPTDVTIENTWGNDKVTLEGGNFYILQEYSSDSAGGADATYTLVGPAGGMSEDELKQAIDDAIHNVEGDQTVNGSQDITGDGFVSGSHTVKSVA